MEAREKSRHVIAISFEVLTLIDFTKIIQLKITAKLPESIAYVPMSGIQANARFNMLNTIVTMLNNFHLRDMGIVFAMPIFYSHNRQ